MARPGGLVSQGIINSLARLKGIEMTTELTHQQRLNRFEIAQEMIGFMMALRTSLIDEEQQKVSPDIALIAQWEAEFDKLDDELYNLQLSDENEIQRVIAEYGPILKASSNSAQSGA